MAADLPTVPRWIPFVLNAAAAYNVTWGLFVILFPLEPFRWAGLDLPNYPALVQCLGMLVGVYGVGYALAARDPVALWPLVLVGLLGKIFGPIGFVYAASLGEFPWFAGWAIVTNDLAWWIPFTAILFQVGRLRDAQQAVAEGLTLEEALRTAKTQRGESLFDLSRQQVLLIVCLRHSGCTYCREALDDLAKQRPAIREARVRPIVVHMGTVEQGEALVRKYGLDDLDHVSDPERRVYRGLELRLGTLSQLFGMRNFWRALVGGTVFRFGFGRFVGNGLQMPGAFLVRDGQIVKAFRHESPSDRPDYTGLACTTSESDEVMIGD